MNTQFIPRQVTDKLEGFLMEKQIIVVTGMRRVGKTTQLKHLFKQIKSENKLFLDLENLLTRKIFEAKDYQSIKSALENESITFDKKAYIFIDEIQLAPQLPSVIKYFYDKYQVKFVVSGSSSYYIKNHFTESLAGRKFVVELFPLTFSEFLDFKDVKKTTIPDLAKKAIGKSELSTEKYQHLYQEYITYGGFPDVVLAKNTEIKNEVLKDIINSYFQIDVASLADFSDIPILRDLLVLLTQRIGQKLNITNLASALNITRAKVYQYLEFLKSTYVIYTISQHSSVDNRVSGDDKCYFTDTGLANLLGSVSSGSQLENSIFMNLRYDYQLQYFQTKSGGEIDFILDEKIGLEVKETASQQDYSILKKRADALNIAIYYIVTNHYSSIENVIMAWDL